MGKCVQELHTPVSDWECCGEGRKNEEKGGCPLQNILLTITAQTKMIKQIKFQNVSFLLQM
jgi:hypothetical protein